MNEAAPLRVRPYRVRARTPFAMATALAAVGLALAASTPTSARANAWPQPAAGMSVSGGPEIIFTFDDGPSPATTGKVLDILAAHHIKAVFFLVGWRFQRGEIEQNKALTARIVQEGHIVGNHSMSHAQFCGLDAARLDIEIGGARTLIEGIAGMPVPWYRVPYGSRCLIVEEALARHGYGHFHWDIDPQEWQSKSWKATAAAVIKQLALLDGRAVLLMHDTKVATTFALPQILGWIATENARRRAIGRPAIRIVSAPELAAEQVTPMLDWLRLAGASASVALEGALADNIP